eukprot:NODE_767_length_4055_cov_0.722952.p2 type:complete len:292 gc:universal NODE_767_length_4055_cov_0.722952:134-1009(+)
MSINKQQTLFRTKKLVMGNYISINDRDRLFHTRLSRRQSGRLSVKTTFLGSHNKIAATPPLSSTPILGEELSPTPIDSSNSDIKVKKISPVLYNYDTAPTVPTTPTLMMKQKVEKSQVPSDMELLRNALKNAQHKKRSRKCNSTSTIFLQYTLYKGSIPNSIRQISNRIVEILAQNEILEVLKSNQLLDEGLYPLDANIRYSSPHVLPKPDEVERFLLPLFLSSQLSAEAAIIFYIYLERTIRHSEVTFSCANWARWLLGAAIMTSKVWEDQAVWNVDFCQLFPNLDVGDL